MSSKTSNLKEPQTIKVLLSFSAPPGVLHLHVFYFYVGVSSSLVSFVHRVGRCQTTDTISTFILLTDNFDHMIRITGEKIKRSEDQTLIGEMTPGCNTASP